MVFLQSHGVGTARAVRIYKTYGDQAVELVRANPYRLATDIWGVGFQTADELAERLGIDRASPLRARAAAALCPAAAERRRARRLSRGRRRRAHGRADRHRPGDRRRTPSSIERHEGELVREHARIVAAAPEPLALPEAAVPGRAGRGPRRCGSLREGDHPLPAIDDRAGPGLGREEDGPGAGRRRSATPSARRRRSKVLVITGGPGVGKTTIVRGILEIFAAKGLRCALCARPAGPPSAWPRRPAARRKTIHRLLEFDPALGGFKRDRDDPLDARSARRRRGVDGGRRR